MRAVVWRVAFSVAVSFTTECIELLRDWPTCFASAQKARLDLVRCILQPPLPYASFWHLDGGSEGLESALGGDLGHRVQVPLEQLPHLLDVPGQAGVHLPEVPELRGL